MIGVSDAFGASYAQARAKFLTAAAEAGLLTESHKHPLPGLEGEVLAMDVARDGAPDAQALLLVSSGCHGVEGYCGSGVQVFALHDEEWRAKVRDQGVAVLYLHALNPYGFSYVSRTTHENVDLNRNFHDFSQPVPVNTAYRDVHPLLLPEHWPPDAENQAAIGRFVAERGMAALQAAVSGGQHEFANGLFFGGTAPSWSNLTLRRVLAQHGRQAQRLAWIDVHTGLGPSGIGERIYAGPDEATATQRARQWWGSGDNHVTSVYDGSSTSSRLTGMMWSAVGEECPQAEYTGIAMEYGTVPVLESLQALRGSNWLRQHPEAPAALAAQIRQQMMASFYTDTDAWRGQVISQARQAMFQAIDGLRK